MSSSMLPPVTSGPSASVSRLRSSPASGRSGSSATAASSTPPPAVGLYLYAVAPADAGIHSLTVTGVEGRPVRAFVEGDLAVFVSEAEVRTYELNRTNLMAHQRVLEALVGRTPHLPVKFCTVATGEAQVVDRLLAPRRAELLEKLTYFAAREEFSLKVLVQDMPGLYAEVARVNPALKARQERLAKLPAAAARDPLLQLGQEVKQALDRFLDEYSARLFAKLRPLASEAKEAPRGGDRLAANHAYLLTRGEHPAFDATVLAEAAGPLGFLKHRLFGPASPSNFVEIRVSWN